jgi:hypothetical protein
MDLATLKAATAPSKRGLQMREAAQNKRLKQHQENESNRPEDKRLLTRKDLDDIAVRFVCAATLHAYAYIVRWFEQFTTEVLGLPVETAHQYFQRGGSLPTLKVIRQFLFFLADGGCGARGGKVARITIEGYATSFFGVLRYCNRPHDRDTREQIYLWIRYNLTDELELQKGQILSKPVAYATDVTLILSKLYSPLGLRGCMSMRLVLNMSMFINFMVDTCGRAHEIVSTIRYPNLYLRWRDVKIYVFKSAEGGIEFTGNLRLTNMKGMKDEPDKWKEVPLKLMPVKLCFEDSLRLILLAALIDGRISGAKTWQDLEKIGALCATESGRLLPFTAESMDLPIMPMVNHVTSEVVYTSPMHYDCVQRQLRRVGKLCGFRDTLKR